MEGVIDIAMETTTQVQDRRRLALLARLTADLADVAYLPDVAQQALQGCAPRPRTWPRSTSTSTASSCRRGRRGQTRSWLGSDVVLQDDAGGTLAWLPLSEGEDSAAPGMLVVRLHPMIAQDARYLQFLQLVAAALAQALGRVAAREERRRAAADGRAMSEALQRSLLDHPHARSTWRWRCATWRPPSAPRSEVTGTTPSPWRMA